MDFVYFVAVIVVAVFFVGIGAFAEAKKGFLGKYFNK